MMAGIAKPPFTIKRIVRSVGCREDHQCPTGYFCEVTRLSCRECLSCKELNRQNLQGNVTSCFTSVASCGACFAGLVPGKTDNKCVVLDGQQLLLPYEWAVITVSLLLAVIICAAAVYVLLNFDTFKVLASTRTSVHTPVDVEASAPQFTPAYSDVVPPANQYRNDRNDDESVPFIKPIFRFLVKMRPASRWGGKGARVFNKPSNARTLQPPGTPTTTLAVKT